MDGTYPPGSTFKLATATAALQTGLITPVLDFQRPWIVHHPELHRPGVHLHGQRVGGPARPIDVDQALTVSSDVFFYNLGYQFWQQPAVNTGFSRSRTSPREYGYGQPTGIDLPEQSLAQVDSPKERIKLHDEYPKAFPIRQLDDR